MIFHSKPTIGEEEIQAVVNCLKSLQLKSGSQVKELEEKIAEAFNYKSAFAASKGSLAITLAIKTLFKNGNARIALPSYICRSVYDAICLANCRPVVLDIDSECLSVSLEAALKAAPDAVIVPHMFGIRAPVEDFLREKLIVIEDCAQRVPTPEKMRSEPKAHFKMLSFEATKLLTCGEGGMVLCDDNEYINTLGNIVTAPYTFKESAYQFLLTDIQASMVLAQWEKLPHFLEKRRRIADTYIQKLREHDLAEYIHPSMFREDTYHFRFILTVNKVQDFINHMEKHKIICRRPVAPFGIHNLFDIKGSFKNTDDVVRSLVSLPIYPGLDETDMDKIIKETVAFFGDR